MKHAPRRARAPRWALPAGTVQVLRRAALDQGYSHSAVNLVRHSIRSGGLPPRALILPMEVTQGDRKNKRGSGLGAVAHAFAQMTLQLGGTVSRVAMTAVRVEEAAGELAKIGSAVREVTTAQLQGIERAKASVGVVSRQASEITGSAQELIGGVEDASSSVLELGAASEELNQTAIALNAQVEAVGVSIDQMVRSVAHAGEATEALNGAVADTNSSVAEMARSLQSVDAHARETARLSTRMIELADGGRDRVQETIRGMEVIRDATDSANRTIGGLADRMQEIGAIVDVRG